MNTTHDTEANATYYTLNPTSERTVAKTVKVSDRCTVDLDEEGYPLGVEVLDA